MQKKGKLRIHLFSPQAMGKYENKLGSLAFGDNWPKRITTLNSKSSTQQLNQHPQQTGGW